MWIFRYVDDYANNEKWFTSTGETENLATKCKNMEHQNGLACGM